MKTTPLDRLHYQGDLADTRFGRLIYACVPTLARTNFDTDTQSGLDLSDGLGEAASAWRVYAFRSNVRDVDVALLTYGHVPPGVILGDVLISFGLRDLPALTQVTNDPNGYIDIDGVFFQADRLTPSGVGYIEEYTANCRAHTPVHRAPGH